MCWRTYYGMLTKRRTASKDIPVKKAFVVMKSEIRSLYYSGFRWTQGVLRKGYIGNVRRFRLAHIDDHAPRSYVWIIEEGFHSAKDVKIDGFYRGCFRLEVSNGKGYDRIFDTKHKIGVEILNCIIPKGSKYYLNEYGEYVSDQLIVLPNP